MFSDSLRPFCINVEPGSVALDKVDYKVRPIEGTVSEIIDPVSRLPLIELDGVGVAGAVSDTTKGLEKLLAEGYYKAGAPVIVHRFEPTKGPFRILEISKLE